MRWHTKRSAWCLLFLFGSVVWGVPGGLRAADILFVGGGDPDPTGGDDQFVFDHLTDDLSHDVTYMSGDASGPDDGLAADLIIISSTLGSGSVRSKFHDSPTPVLNWEEAIMDGTTAAGNFSMGAGGVNGGGTENFEITILEPGHPLAAGLTGTVEFALDPIRLPRITGQLAPGVTGIAGMPTDGEPIELVPAGPGVHMGSNNNGENAFVGGLDEMAIWNRALSFQVDANNNLTGGEVHTIYNQGIPALGNANPGPIGYWSFEDQGDDTLAVDDSGSGNDALLDGGAFYADDDAAPNAGGSGSLLVDGTGLVNADIIERPGDELAYSFWFKPDSAVYADTLDTADLRVDFYYGNSGPVRPHLSANRNGRPVGLYVRDASGDIGTPLEAATGSFDSDEWHHVVISWDGDLGSIFVDGKLDNQVSLTDGSDFTITAVEAGGELWDGTDAAGPRVNFPIEDTGFASLTDDGILLFDAAIDWLLNPAPQVPGDFDGDGLLTANDVNLLSAQIAAVTNDPAFDLNADSLVNSTDLSIWVKDLKNTWFGDADLDGEFNSGDFVLVFQEGLFEKDELATWGQGDWDADLRFSSGDFVKAFQDGGFEMGPRPAVSAVPEPTGLASLIAGLLGLLWAAGRRPA